MKPHDDKPRRSLEVLVIGTILGIAGTVAAYSFLGRGARLADLATDPEVQVATVPRAGKPESVEPDLQAKLRGTQSELAAALARIDALYAERNREWQQTSQWIEALLASFPETFVAKSERFERFLRRFTETSDSDTAFSWRSFEDAMRFLVAAALAGDNAAVDLSRAVMDPDLDISRRWEALQILTFLPSARSLDILLDPPAEVAQHFAYDVTDSHIVAGFAFMAAVIPSNEFQPYADRLYDVGAGVLNNDAESEEALSLIGTLAFEHGHARSLQLLSDPRLIGTSGDYLLRVAWWAGTEASRNYIEHMSRTHPSPDVRQKAADILANWP